MHTNIGENTISILSEPINGIEQLFLQDNRRGQSQPGPEQPAATPIIYQAGSQVCIINPRLWPNS